MLGVKHLFDLGHTRIDFGMDADNIGSAEDVDRWNAFQSACAALGLEPGKRVEMYYTTEDAEKWLSDPDRGTGIVLRTENLASHIYVAAEKMNLKVPQDFSIVGFDSTEFCETLSPRLTAIHQPIRDMVYEAVSLLIRRIEGDETGTRTHLFPCGLDIRESTAPPPSKVA